MNSNSFKDAKDSYRVLKVRGKIPSGWPETVRLDIFFELPITYGAGFGSDARARRYAQGARTMYLVTWVYHSEYSDTGQQHGQMEVSSKEEALKVQDDLRHDKDYSQVRVWKQDA